MDHTKGILVPNAPTFEDISPKVLRWYLNAVYASWAWPKTESICIEKP